MVFELKKILIFLVVALSLLVNVSIAQEDITQKLYEELMDHQKGLKDSAEVKKERLSRIRNLLVAGADPNYRIDIHRNMTITHHALFLRLDPDILRLLVEFNGDINKPYRLQGSGRLLSRYIRRGNKSLIKLLLEYGAEVNYSYETSMGRIWFPLRDAMLTKDKEIVDLLLAAGARMFGSDESIGPFFCRYLKGKNDAEALRLELCETCECHWMHP